MRLISLNECRTINLKWEILGSFYYLYYREGSMEIIRINNLTPNPLLNNIINHWVLAHVFLGRIPILLFNIIDITGLNHIVAGISPSAEIPAGKGVLSARLTPVYQPGNHHAENIKHQEYLHRPGWRAGHCQ
ncbi:protein of unknown function [Serratia sp. Tan611]|nr:protein of unknown function [Serratia sp. Tan611]